MAGVSVPVHAPVIDWIVQNIHEDQVAPDVLDQLNTWKAGEKQPTLKQLEAMSRKTRIPFGYFLLQTPPDEDIALAEYRTKRAQAGTVGRSSLRRVLQSPRFCNRDCATDTGCPCTQNKLVQRRKKCGR